MTRYAGSFVAHNHPLASWSAVYCVRAGERPPGQPESGMLRFMDTRAGADSYLDPANRRLHPPYRPTRPTNKQCHTSHAARWARTPSTTSRSRLPPAGTLPT